MTRSKNYRKVSSDAFDRHDFNARLSQDTQHPPPAYEKPEHITESDLDSGEEDALDTLLEDDPMHATPAGKKANKRQQRKWRKAMRKGRGKLSKHVLGVVFLIVLLLAGGAVVCALMLGGKAPSTAVQETNASVEEVLKGMTEVPTLIGSLPIDMGHPVLNEVPDVAPIPSKEDDGSETAVNDPPALSAEAVDQVLSTNAQLADKTSAAVEAAEAAVAQAAEDGKEAASEAGSRFMDMWDDMMAWMDAKWADIVGNVPGQTEAY
ncbi:hypothetical protein BCR37DRAFT_379891 [Protomyces lactucae-debilis]|uniref:Uncharacterized protein n=1 Tax=Protomyces lactucae-debilis TaxID=2754530 RepID=A0A1Y2FDH0_PROLT|nr:uncharacterized protein BCR37DRAFT_379891 [Protomyces lactucae-debilis]ORY81978.1 hypothetical protein BCR37DRAFT_379891 [Protomyces lactucae-debilis]